MNRVAFKKYHTLLNDRVIYRCENFPKRALDCVVQGSNLVSIYRTYFLGPFGCFRVDTVDHDILLQRLQTTFGIDGVALKWFQSYLTGRTQYVRRGSARSTTVHLTCSVPQGSVLGPILFIMYTVDLVSLAEQYGLSAHLYADDTQIYGFCPPSTVSSQLPQITTCLRAVADWMQTNRLQ